MKAPNTKIKFSLSVASLMLLVGLDSQAFNLADALNTPVTVKTGATLPTTPPVAPTPLKKNPLTVDGRTYLLPDYLKIIQSDDGKFSVFKGAGSVDHKVGNGGDYLRAQFLTMGHQVISFLENADDGKKLISDRQLNVDALKATLDINKLAVVNDLLIDNTGSVVDAIGVPDLIILNSDLWMDHFERERNVYYLVFHEMLRSAAVNDDNYLISQNTMNIPPEYKIRTQLIPSLPLLDEDSMAAIVDRSKLQTAGTGCPLNTNRLFTDLNLNENTLDLSFYDYITNLNAAGPAFDRKACSLVLPVNLPKNKKLVVSLIDIQGQMVGVALSTSTAKVSFEAFLAGSSQKVQVKTIALNQGKRTFLYRKTNVLSSTCGGQSQLRLNSNIILQKASASTPQSPNEVLQVKKIRVFMNVEDCTP